MSQSGYEQPVESNPNPLGTCFCGVLREDCPAGSGFVSPQEIEGVPGNYANFISLECVKRLAGDERERRRAGEASTTLVGHPTGGLPHAGSTSAAVILPAPHVNPTGESLEEATRLLEEQDDDEPVI